MGKRLKPEEIIAKLREVEVRLARGETAGRLTIARAGRVRAPGLPCDRSAPLYAKPRPSSKAGDIITTRPDRILL